MIGIFKHTVSKGVKELGQYMIDNPLDWKLTGYRYQCKSNKDINIWVANGLFFIGINGFKIHLIEKIYLSLCIKKSMANRLNYSLFKETSNDLQK